ncbi:MULTISPECIES: hypothetical protein [Catenuloplanes]|uniref:Transmembrane transport protein n=1 Tax=Catenuloplanes niger TaxID=587534 RepID=A0AAE3ZU94_9ACTN|nr:hypothetical protein [Catenuloplanes niger]MDR7326193.1 hypothetical protein [Catenuloplanes niger]
MNADDLIRTLTPRLSPVRRIAAVLAGLGGLTVATVVASLWLTEPALPADTRAAFAGIVVIGLAWAGYAVWLLTRRHPLFARDRVIAAWLSLTACTILAVFVVAVSVARDQARPAALVLSVTLLAVAAVNLVRARGQRAALLRRKRELGG